MSKLTHYLFINVHRLKFFLSRVLNIYSRVYEDDMISEWKVWKANNQTGCSSNLLLINNLLTCSTHEIFHNDQKSNENIQKLILISVVLDLKYIEEYWSNESSRVRKLFFFWKMCFCLSLHSQSFVF